MADGEVYNCSLSQRKWEPLSFFENLACNWLMGSCFSPAVPVDLFIDATGGMRAFTAGVGFEAGGTGCDFDCECACVFLATLGAVPMGGGPASCLRL